MYTNDKILKFIIQFLFIAVFVSLSITNSLFISKGIETTFIKLIKYIILGIGIVFYLFQIILIKIKTKIKLKFCKEFITIFCMILIFTIISLFQASKVGKFSFDVFYSLSYIFIAITYAFFIINLFEFRMIYNCMAIILVVAILDFIFIEKGIHIFTIENLKSISFSNSYSVFESNYSSGLAFALSCFFIFFNKKRLFTILGIIFVFLTFKRAILILTILYFIVSIIFETNKKLPNYTKYLIGFIFVIATLLYKNEIINDPFGFRKFTMGRSTMLYNLVTSNFQSFGYNSSTVYLQKNIEMDLIRISLEMGLIGLVIFSFSYWTVTGDNFFNIMCMTGSFVNLLVSHSLSSSFNWIITFILFGSILYYKNITSYHYKFFVRR